MENITTTHPEASTSVAAARPLARLGGARRSVMIGAFALGAIAGSVVTHSVADSDPSRARTPSTHTQPDTTLDPCLVMSRPGVPVRC